LEGASDVLARGAELADGAIFHLTGVVSGHTVKHLLGAGAVGALAAMLARRRSLTVLTDLSWVPPGPGVRPAGEG
jgi:hypothetical protein